MKRALWFLTVIVGLVFTQASAEERSHDALARARAKAEWENQRVLLLLTDRDSPISEALSDAVYENRKLAKLLREEYQLAALPAASAHGVSLRERLTLSQFGSPALAVLDTEDRVLGTLNAEAMVSNGSFAPDTVRRFLEKHVSSPVNAREVLSNGLAVARKSGRHVFVYLSAPW